MSIASLIQVSQLCELIEPTQFFFSQMQTSNNKEEIMTDSHPNDTTDSNVYSDNSCNSDNITSVTTKSEFIYTE